MDELWPNTPTSTADSHLSKSISHLRKYFTIRTTGHRSVYELLDEVWLDIEECERLVLLAEKIGRFTEEGVQYLEQAARLLDRGACLESESWSWCHAIRAPVEETARCCRSWLVQAYENVGLYLNAQVQRRRLEPEGANEMNRRDMLKLSIPSIFLGSPVNYAAGVAVLWRLTFEGRMSDVMNLLPLYQVAITLEAQKRVPTQRQMMYLVAQLQLIQAEILLHKTDFVSAHICIESALSYAQESQDVNVITVTLLRQANTWFQARDFEKALIAYKKAETMTEATPLLTGYAQIGLAKTYANLSSTQDALNHMGLAYEKYPDVPGSDPAYRYTQYGIYDLMMYGEVLTRLQLKQPKQAQAVLQKIVSKNIGDKTDPMTPVDLEYYKVLTSVRLGELDTQALISSATLAAQAGSTLYVNKNKATLLEMRKRWPNDLKLKKLELPTAQLQ